jgi:hypothetical protein
MTSCDHRKCDICLRPICHRTVGILHKFGALYTCADCVTEAVEWAYTSARKWGGEYPKRPCGYNEKTEEKNA